MVKLFQCERNTFKNTRIFNWSKIRLVPCERNHRGFKAKKNLSWITNLPESAMISFHFLSVQMQKMFLLMKVIATAVLLTTVYLMKKGAYYLFIITRSWKLVQSFTRDPSILTCSRSTVRTGWLTGWRFSGQMVHTLNSILNEGGVDAILLFLFSLSFFLSFSTLLAPQTNENYLFFQVSFWNLRSRISQCNCRFAHILLSQLLK